MGLTSQYLKSTNLSTVFSPYSFNLILSGSLYFTQTNATLHPLSLLHPWLFRSKNENGRKLKIRSFHYKSSLLYSRKLVEHLPKDESTEELSSWKLKPSLFTGFVDAEGCFNVSIYKDNKFNTGWRIKLNFSIILHEKYKPLLEQIKILLKVGSITKQRSKAIQFRVQSIKELKKIFNHF